MVTAQPGTFWHFSTFLFEHLPNKERQMFRKAFVALAASAALGISNTDSAFAAVHCVAHYRSFHHHHFGVRYFDVRYFSHFGHYHGDPGYGYAPDYYGCYPGYGYRCGYGPGSVSGAVYGFLAPY
jgi:hypothetical protein